MKKISKDAKVMIGVWVPFVIFSVTAVSLVIANPLGKKEEKPDTKALIFLKNGADTSSILPTSINEINAKDYFDYSISGDEVEGATYTLVPSEADDVSGTIKISLMASKAYVDGAVLNDQTIGEEVFLDLQISIITFWDESHTYKIHAKGTNGEIIEVDWINLENYNSADTKQKKATIPSTIIYNGNEIIIVELANFLFAKFANRKDDSEFVLKEVIFEGTNLKKIEYSAFSSNQLTSLTIPNSVATIELHAFSYNQLTSLTIGNSVTTIEPQAFYKNQLTSLIIPDSVTEIGDLAFAENNFDSSSKIILPKKFDTHEERKRIFEKDYWSPPKTSNKTHATTPLNQEKDKNNKRKKE